MKLQIDGLAYRIEQAQILSEVHLQIMRGQFVGLIGPNGSGKSTLLRNVYRALKPDHGVVLLDGTNIHQMPYRQSAKKMAVLKQESGTDFDYSVRELVAMGRSPHHGLFEPDNEEDERIVSEALEKVGMLRAEGRALSTLSGGEKQRVLLARALAQQTDFLILDEPTNHLDVYYKIQIMEMVKALGITALAAIHDLDLAGRYCDRIIVLNAGRVVAVGPPKEVMTRETFAEVFRVHAELTYSQASVSRISYLGTA